MKVGDRVIITCGRIPGTGIRCEGLEGTILSLSDNACVELDGVRNGTHGCWFFLFSDFELDVSNLPMQEPEFSLDEITMGQEIIHQMD